MTQQKASVAEILPLVEQYKGNVAAIARRFGVTRGTILNRCKESPTLMQALENARETMLDNAESVLYNKVLEGSTVELLFFLKTQGRDRGYIERKELAGVPSQPLFDIDRLIDRIYGKQNGDPETE